MVGKGLDSAVHHDVLIIGAGISGVSAAYHVMQLKKKTFCILERRAEMGGTWDLFRYPGIRSDSDMYTFMFSFSPWEHEKSIGQGADIKKHIISTADKFGITQHIRFNQHVLSVEWDSEKSLWTAITKDGDVHTASFLFCGTGYYNYDQGHEPRFDNQESFQGRVVHPQHWTPDIEYAGKNVVVIGSGATAVTLVPELGKTAKSCTMLQRSPTYIYPKPNRLNKFARFLLSIAGPLRFIVYKLARWWFIIYSVCTFWLAKAAPWLLKRAIAKTAAEFGPAITKQWAQNFTPRYNPWDQRICLSPDGDFYQSLVDGKSQVVTAHIDRFTKDGILLKDGTELPADLIVTATGLKLQYAGGMRITVDGKEMYSGDRMIHKGCMLSDIPNAWFGTGYSNASWTLRVELITKYMSRIIKLMDEQGKTKVIALKPAGLKESSAMDLSSGYVLRSKKDMPKKGDKGAWQNKQNYLIDLGRLGWASVEDPDLHML